MISNIQVLRAYAAISVLIYHTAFPVLPGNHTDFQGVAIFFVISGFIMTHITLRDGRESTPASFFLHRVIRIVPLYCLCTIYVVAFDVYAEVKRHCIVAGSAGSGHAFLSNFIGLPSFVWQGLFSDAFVHRLIEVTKSLLFIPYINQHGNTHPVLAVGWTLNMEMHFYLCFALMLSFGKTRAPALTFALLAVFILFYQSSDGASPLLVLHASRYPLYFCGGILAYYLWRTFERIGAAKLRLGAVPASWLGIAFYLFFNIFPGHFGILIQAGPAILVLSALVLHSCMWRITSRLILLLGAASYALYLTHTLVLELLRILARTYGSLNFEVNIMGFFIAVFAALGIAMAVYWFLELPTTRWMRKKALLLSSMRPAGGF